MESKKSSFPIEMQMISTAAKLLSHPARVSILEILMREESCISSGVIVSKIPLGRSTVLQHLTALKEANWIKAVLNGGQISYCLNSAIINSETPALLQFLTLLKESKAPRCDSNENKTKEKILFLCTGNSCRSQMAEAFFRHLGGEYLFEAVSAGTDPAKEIHPLAVKVMNEKGISMEQQSPQNISDFQGKKEIALVIFVCENAQDDCSLIFPFARGRIKMHFDDPAQFTGSEEETIQYFRKIRDNIEIKMQTLISEIPAK